MEPFISLSFAKLYQSQQPFTSELIILIELQTTASHLSFAKLYQSQQPFTSELIILIELQTTASHISFAKLYQSQQHSAPNNRGYHETIKCALPNKNSGILELESC
jgi:hypothetical protein